MATFRKASKNDEHKIFHFWHKVKKSKFRIFGLSQSIEDGEVYVYYKEGELIGFVRFNLNSNKTNDYIKINEIFVLSGDMFLDKLFFKFVDEYIIRLGYSSARTTMPLESIELFLGNGWKYDCVKTRISGDNSFGNIVMKKEVEDEDDEDWKQRIKKLFGVHL